MATDREAASLGDGGTDILSQCDHPHGLDDFSSSSGASVLDETLREQTTLVLDTTEEHFAEEDEGLDYLCTYVCYDCRTIFKSTDQFNRHDCKKVLVEPVKESSLAVADHWEGPFKCATCCAMFSTHKFCVAHVLAEHKSTTIQHRVSKDSAVPSDRPHGSAREEPTSKTSALTQDQASNAKRIKVMMCKLCHTFYNSEETCLLHIKEEHRSKLEYARQRIYMSSFTLPGSIGDSHVIADCTEVSRKNNEKENCATMKSDYFPDEEMQCPHGSRSPVSGLCEVSEVGQGSSINPEKDNSSSMSQDRNSNSADIICDAANVPRIIKAESLLGDMLDSERNNLDFVEDMDTGICASPTNGLSDAEIFKQQLMVVEGEQGLAAIKFLLSDGIRLKNCFVKLSIPLCHLCNTDYPTSEELLTHVYAVHGISIGPDSGGSSVKLRRSAVKRKRRYFGKKQKNLEVKYPFLNTNSPKKRRQAKTRWTSGPAGKKSVFICPVCASSFPSFAACEDHMKSLHADASNVSGGQEWSSRSQPLVVSLPDEDSNPNLEAITCQYNAQNQTFACASCRAEFATFSSFSQHAITDHAPEPKKGAMPREVKTREVAKPRELAKPRKVAKPREEEKPEKKNEKIKGGKNEKKGKEVPKAVGDLEREETTGAPRVLCFLCGESKRSVKACKKHIREAHADTQSSIGMRAEGDTSSQSSPTVEGMLDLCNNILEGWDSILQEDPGPKGANHTQDKVAKYRLFNDDQTLELTRSTASYQCSVCAQVFESQRKCADHMKREHLPYQLDSRSHEDVVMTLVSADGEEGDGSDMKKIMILHQVEKGRRKDITNKWHHGTIKRRVEAWKREEKRDLRKGASACPVCKRSFKGRQRDLHTHMSSKHCGAVSNFSCKLCSHARTLGRENRLDEVIQSLNEELDHKLRGRKPSNRYSKVQYHECIECGKVFGPPRHLARHKSLHKTFSCRSCGLVCPSYKALYGHSHNHKGPLECGQCPKSFYSSSCYLSHAMTHQTRFSCNYCSRVFTRIIVLKRHKKCCPQRIAGMACKKCGKKCKGKCKQHKLPSNKHQRPKSVKLAAATTKDTIQWTWQDIARKYVCDVCGEEFSNAVKVKFFAHLRTHTPDPLHKCSYCYKGWFTTPNNLAQHVRETHKNKRKKLVEASGDRPYVCSECGRGCYKLSAFMNHLSTHRDKQFTCETCYKIFVTHKELAEHMWDFHRTIICDVCGEQFRFMFELMAHQQQEVPCVPVIVPGKQKRKKPCKEHVTRGSHLDKPFACDTCYEPFKRHGQLAQHKWDIHRTIVCDVCGKLFQYRFELLEHQFQPVPCLPAKPPVVQKKEPEKTVKSQLTSSSSVEGKGVATLPVTRGRKKTEAKDKGKKQEVREHQEEDEEHYECSNCKRKFSSRTYLKNHVRKIKDAPHSCEPCCKIFKDAGALARHKDYHEKMVFSCDQCKKVFSQLHSLELHKALEHKQKIVQPSLFPSCKLCRQTFVTDAVLDSHKCPARRENRQLYPLPIPPPKKTKVKSRDNVPRCHFCGLTFKDDALLASHECKAFRKPATDDTAPTSRIGLPGSIASVEKNLQVVEQAPALAQLEANVAKSGQEKAGKETFEKEFVQCKPCKEWFASSLQLAQHECPPLRPYRPFPNTTPPADPKRDRKRPLGTTASASSPSGSKITPPLKNQPPSGKRIKKNDQQGRRTTPPGQNHSSISIKDGQNNLQQGSNITPPQSVISTKSRQDVQQVVYRQQGSSITPPLQHQLSSNRLDEGQVVYLQCEKCHYKFTDVGQLASHQCIYMMRDQEAHTCRKCNDIFSSKLELIVHDSQMHDATFFHV